MVLRVEERDLLHRVLRQYDIGSVREIRRGGGTASPKWIVVTAEARFIVRKRPPEFAGLDSIRLDHSVLKRMNDQGVPAPLPVETTEDSTWVAIDGEIFELLTWVDGNLFDPNDLRSLEGLGSFLARFHSVTPPQDLLQRRQEREDHPDLIEPYVEPLSSHAKKTGELDGLQVIQSNLAKIRRELDSGLYESLPHTLIHGDIHPGNLRFEDSEVAAVYDFDYVSLQARVRDLIDSMIFFAASRESEVDPDNIWSLTQPFYLDLERCSRLIESYQRNSAPLEDREWEALPLLIRSRWIQMRLRGSRKVDHTEKLPFVLDPLPSVISWLDREAPGFFAQLRGKLS